MQALRPYQPQDENSAPGGIPIYRAGDLKSAATGGPASQCTPQPNASAIRKGGGLGGLKQANVGPQAGGARRALGNITNVTSTPAKGGGLGGATPAKGGGLAAATPAHHRRVLGNLPSKGNGLAAPSASKGKRLQLYDEGPGMEGSNRKLEEVSRLSFKAGELAVARMTAHSEVDALAERYAQDGVESLAGAGWEEQERERRVQEGRTVGMDELFPSSLKSQLAQELYAWEARDKAEKRAIDGFGDDFMLPITDIPTELRIDEPAPQAKNDDGELTDVDMQDALPCAVVHDTSELGVLCE